MVMKYNFFVRDTGETIDRQRRVWPTQIGGFLVAFGFITGAANMSFFPSAICTQGQAGNFVVVYLLCIVLVGFPLTYLHLCLGQYSGCDPIDVFSKLCPVLKGIGWSWQLLMFPLIIVSSMNTAWSLYYMYVSTSVLVLGTGAPWRLHAAVTPTAALPLSKFIAGANTSMAPPFFNYATTPTYFHHLYQTAPPRLVFGYGEDNVLEIISREIELGGMEMRVVAALAITWLCILVCVVHDSVSTLNRVVYVTATLPILCLFILISRVVHLPGASQGIALLFPNFLRITERNLWIGALKLVFLDLQVGTGVLISISRHNRFHTNLFRDAILLVLLDVAVCFFAALVAFGFLGFLSYRLTESDVRSMCRGQIAPHLLWDQILRAIAYLDAYEAPVFALIYQGMVAIGAAACTFTWCESFASVLDYRIPLLVKRPRMLRALTAFLFFALSLPCCFQSGVHIYDLLVHYAMQWNVLLIALAQFLAVSLVYGVDGLFSDIAKMLRLPQSNDKRIFGPTGQYVRHSWTWMCPLAIAIAVILDVLSWRSQRLEGAKRPGDSPIYTVISLVPVLPIPLFALYQCCSKTRGNWQATDWTAIPMPLDDSTLAPTALNTTTQASSGRRNSTASTNSSTDETLTASLYNSSQPKTSYIPMHTLSSSSSSTAAAKSSFFDSVLSSSNSLSPHPPPVLVHFTQAARNGYLELPSYALATASEREPLTREDDDEQPSTSQRSEEVIDEVHGTQEEDGELAETTSRSSENLTTDTEDEETPSSPVFFGGTGQPPLLPISTLLPPIQPATGRPTAITNSTQERMPDNPPDYYQ